MKRTIFTLLFVLIATTSFAWKSYTSDGDGGFYGDDGTTVYTSDGDGGFYDDSYPEENQRDKDDDCDTDRGYIFDNGSTLTSDGDGGYYSD